MATRFLSFSRAKGLFLLIHFILASSAYAVSSQEYLFETATAYWKSQAIYLVAKLQIADYLKEGPQTIEVLAKSAHVNPESLYRVLRTLATEDVFQELEGRKFALAEKGKCLRSDVACSIRNALVMYGSEQFKAWSNLETSLTGSTSAFEKTFGKPVFKYFKDNPDAGRTFNSAMKELAGQIYSQSNLISAYPFGQFKKIVDIGGGNGAFLSEILQGSPQAEGILFDLPEVISDLEKTGKNQSWPSRMKLVKGDFFKSIPTGGDLYILKRVLHDWDDDTAQKILRQVKQSMGPASKLLAIELVVEKNVIHSLQVLPHWIDLHMMVMTGGQERTDLDFARILAKSGLKLHRIIPTQAKLSIIEATF